MALVLFVILIISDLVIINMQKQELRRDAVAHTKFELEEAAAFMVEPLLTYQFSDINQFIHSWSESHKDVIQFQAISPTGHILTSFSRPIQKSAQQITVKKEIEYAGKSLLMLSITKDINLLLNP